MRTVQTPPPVPDSRISKRDVDAAARSSRTMKGSASITDWAEVSVKRSVSTSRSARPWRIHQRAIDVMMGLRERPCSVSA